MTTSSTSSPVSVASSTSAGAAGGSVINVSSLVSQLITATEAPQQNLINNQTQAVTAQISALGTLKSALATFQSALSALDTPSAFNTETATTASTAFTATVKSGAPVGTYNVTVSQLASAQQLLSGAIKGTTVGTGTLQVSLGSTNFSVTIGSGQDTLNGIAAAINSASGNPGVTATVLQGTDGPHLLLTSSQTGAANTIGVSETDSGTALSALTYNIANADSNGNTTNYTQQAAAQDAQYSISGVGGTSSSNTVTTALTNVTLNLVAKTPSGTGIPPATLTVASDSSTIQSNVSAFVTAYNTLVGTFSSLGSYDPTTQTAGPMLGNALLSSTKSQVQNAIYSIVNTGSSTYNSLASVGITTNKDGTLSLNSTTLGNALSTNFGAVSALFSSPGGVATNLNTQLTTDLGSSGAIASKATSLTAQETALTNQTTQLNAQMTALSASLTQQYSALNNLLSALQTTSSYLTQAFASLPQIQGTSNA